MIIHDKLYKEYKIKDIFSKDIINKELEYITQHNTLNNTNISLNYNIKFNSYEYYSMLNIIILYNCLSDINLKYPEDKKIKRDYEIVKKIVNFKKYTPFQIEEDYFKVLKYYGYPLNYNVSRIYPVSYCNDSSIVFLFRQIKYYLFKDIYKDIDLVNAHSTILYNFATENNINCLRLSLLVHNRDEVFSDIMKSENKDKNTVKRKLLVILNLYLLDKEKNTFYREFSHEILNIRETIWNTYVLQDTQIKDYLYHNLEFKSKPLNKQKKSAQTVYCFTKESELVMCLYNTLHKHSKEFNTELSFVPFFDGAYARYKDPVAHSKIIEYIDEVNKLIIPFKFVSKPIEPNWSYLNESILNNYKHIITLFSSDLVTQKQLEKLIDHFQIPDVNLCEKGYEIIKSQNKEKISNLSDNNLNEYLELKSRNFARCFNDLLLPYSNDYETLENSVLSILENK